MTSMTEFIKQHTKKLQLNCGPTKSANFDDLPRELKNIVFRMNRKSNGRINRDSMARHRKQMKWVHHELDIFEEYPHIYNKSTWENEKLYVSPSDLLIKFDLCEIDDLSTHSPTGRHTLRLKENLNFSWHHGLDQTLRCHAVKETVQKELLRDQRIRRVILRLDHGYEFVDDSDGDNEFIDHDSFCGNYCLGDCLTCLGMD